MMEDKPAQKPFVIPIFIPHAGCPHRCVFCDQTRTTRRPEALPSAAQVDETVTRFLNYRKDPARYTEISFYGGNFLGLPTQSICALLTYADHCRSKAQIQGIRFSTRPDTITPRRLALLTGYAVTTVELGVQSMNDHVLQRSRRGHSVSHIHRAVSLLKKTSYCWGLQMMVGLPGDTNESAMATGEKIASFKPDFVRIYPTLVLKGSRLAQWYRQGRYDPMTLKGAVALVKKLYALFAGKGIKVVRMGLQAAEGLQTGQDLVAGPFHPAFGELVLSALWLETILKHVKNNPLEGETVIISLHPKLMSRVRGHHNKNLEPLCRKFELPHIHFSTDNDLPLDTVRINGRPCGLFNG
jgi:histone acetyltransferase (RNA polymerase elongator complex component)